MGFMEKAKPFRDYVPDEEIRHIKRAIKLTIAKIGKAEAVVAHFKRQNRSFDGGRVTEWCDLDRPTSMPNVWQMLQLEAMAGVDWITEALCSLHDADLVKRAKVDGDGEILERMATAARESGESTAQAAAVLMAKGCEKTIRAAIKETDEAIRARQALRASLEKLLAEAED